MKYDMLILGILTIGSANRKLMLSQ